VRVSRLRRDSRDGCATNDFTTGFGGGHWPHGLTAAGIEERLALGWTKRLALDGGLQDHPVTRFRAAAALSDDLSAGANRASARCAAPHPPHVETDPQPRTLHRIALSEKRLIPVHFSTLL
jgi:hypothetical protein